MQPLHAVRRRALDQLFRAPRPETPLRPLPQPRPTQATLRMRTSASTSMRRLATSTIARRPVTWAQLAGRTCRTSRTCRTGGRYNSSSASSAAEQPLSLSQRLKKLSREYGWAAVGVYFTLSALDFPFCFLAVRTLGTDRIGHWEHVIVSRHVDHGYKEAEAANRGSNASIWTQLALAYAIHKSFIFLRVPLTAAVTPKVVKTLRGWGWNIGTLPKRAPKTVD
ncbi:hypothetical protein DV736_g6061, partial [Chaetothyriales sp. CBS 134916]